MVAPIQVALAADIVDPARRMGLDNRTWDMTFQGLLALVPNAPGGGSVFLKSDTPDAVHIHCSSLSPGQSVPNYDHSFAEICVFRPSAGQDAGPPLVHVESIDLDLQLGDVEAVDTLPWGGLQPVVDSPHMRCLSFSHYGLGGANFEVSKRMLCSVLRRSQLTWALESGKLQFKNYCPGLTENPVTRADILSVTTEHTIDGTTIALDIAEQAEWLLRPVHSRFKADADTTKEHYLRKLVTNRTSGVSTDAVSGTALSTADSVQDTAVEQIWEAAEGDGPGDEQGEETGGVSDEESIHGRRHRTGMGI
ncbi:uncharacterized protein PHACADRAFT_202689 [Phanerochaete carnosa HHB-10118-sp]|uniref:Uncharacterized protein n=1 Tax=Phanerochaete carnosa (strain HHB-10118-sp) TaxID=650164 RepID=K5VP94_PHACS|nr:uncharacterized protein PHACADRAFT_202689 [Phanerochaete carnosa HHB-10118-sp]EKM48540.1 hypothetical protein PHACADRAFT_202689 [Phanerochaete carnosa HHB-10118-sp]